MGISPVHRTSSGASKRWRRFSTCPGVLTGVPRGIGVSVRADRLAWRCTLVLAALAPLVFTPQVPYDPFAPAKDLFTRGMAVVILVAWGMGRVRGSEAALSRPPAVCPRGRQAGVAIGLAAAIGGFAPSLVQSVDPVLSLEQMANLALLGSLALVIADLLTPERSRRLLYVLVASAAISGAYTVLQLFGHDPIFIPVPEAYSADIMGRRKARTLAGGLFGNPLTMGAYLAAAALLAWGMIRVARTRRARAGAWVALGLITAGLLATQTRSALFALGIGALATLGGRLMGGAWGERKARRDLAWGVGLIGALVLLALVAFPGLRTRLAESTNLLSSRNDRVLMWRVALAMFRDHPAVGIGLGTYTVRYREYEVAFLADPDGQRVSGLARPEQAHNDFLQALAEGGLLGAAGVVWLGSAYFALGLRGLRRAGPSGERVEWRRMLVASLVGAQAAILGSAAASFPFHVPPIAVLAALCAAMTAGGEAEAAPRADAQVPRSARGRIVKPALLAGGLAAMAWLILQYVAQVQFSPARHAFVSLEQVGTMPAAERAAAERRLLAAARTGFEASLRWNPRDGLVRTYLATTYLLLEEPARALAEFRRAGRNFRDTDVYFLMGQAFELAGRLPEARWSYHRALGSRPNDPEFRRRAEALSPRS